MKDTYVEGWPKVQDVYMDFETYSEVSVVDVGAWRYAMDPSTEVLCLAYSLDAGPTKLWKQGDPDPVDLIQAIEDGALVHAHNAAFEYAIWNYVQTHWPRLRPSQMRCTAALSAYHSLPFSLDKVTTILKTRVQKDKDGKRLLNKFSKPRKPTKANPSTRIRPKDDPEDFKKLCGYCIQDVDAEISVLDALPLQQLPRREQRIYELDLLINERGVKIDRPTVERIVSLATDFAKEMEDEIERRFGFKSSQRQAVMDWALLKHGYQLKNFQAEYLAEVLKLKGVPKDVRTVLEARSHLGKTSVTKYLKMIEVAGPDDVVRGSIQYYGASRTGRFAGRLLQVHNLPRGTIKKIEALAVFIQYMVLEDIKLIFDRPMEAFSSLIRSMIVSKSGKYFYVADFSNIEGRVLAWMAGQADVVAQFAAGDDVYKHMAAVIFSTLYELVTDDERFVGKQAVLGCGYGMGPDKFLITCIGYGRDIGIELARKTVKIYRQKNKKIVEAWYAVERAALAAVRNPGTVTETFMCTFECRDGFMWITLPSRKRQLAYRNPRIEDGRLIYEGLHQKTNQWGEVDTYGGKLVENIVQAVARDIMTDAMLRVEDLGYEVVMTVHDELVSEHEDPDRFEEYVGALRVTEPWADGCPVDAAGWVGDRYKK